MSHPSGYDPPVIVHTRDDWLLSVDAIDNPDLVALARAYLSQRILYFGCDSVDPPIGEGVRGEPNRHVIRISNQNGTVRVLHRLDRQRAQSK